MKNVLMIFLASFSVIISQLLLKNGMTGYKWNGILSIISHIFTTPTIIMSLFIQIAAFILWLFVLSKSNLGYAFGVSGAFVYLVLPLISWLFLGEKLFSFQWVGIILIATGLLLLTVVPTLIGK